MMDKLTPNEVAELAEELDNISKRYILEGHVLLAIRGGQTTVVGHVSPSILSTLGPSILKMMADRMAKS